MSDSTSSQPTLSTTLRPSDPFARPLPSHPCDVNYILLRTTIPRRTGRRRRKGTSDPFTYPPDHIPSSTPTGRLLKADQVLDKLRDTFPHSGGAGIEVLGTAKTAHRFRSLPDFQLVDDAPMLKAVHDLTHAPTVEAVKAIVPTPAEGRKEGMVEIVGPPGFAGTSQQMRYMYQQVRKSASSGEKGAQWSWSGEGGELRVEAGPSLSRRLERGGSEPYEGDDRRWWIAGSGGEWQEAEEGLRWWEWMIDG